MSTKIPVAKYHRDLPLAIVRQMLALATSGFGLVAALAWNETVKALIEEFVRPYLPQGSTVISLVVYATIVTTLAVAVTLQLTKIQQKLESSSPKH